ncbi:recombination protein NinB [Citrobacter freundii]|uniref:recombination protein NinB n=1 Tax=Citrobacter freundii TaxID=546 RepID=UPI00388DCE9C
MQWAGKSRDLASWKVLYVSGHAIATGKPGEVVPGLEGEFCAIRESTAKMGIRRMTSLIEYSRAFAVQNGVCNSVKFATQVITSGGLRNG